MHAPLGAARRWTPSWPSYVGKKAASVTFETVTLLGNAQQTVGNQRETRGNSGSPRSKRDLSSLPYDKRLPGNWGFASSVVNRRKAPCDVPSDSSRPAQRQIRTPLSNVRSYPQLPKMKSHL